jgi:hypothetical protein
MVTKLLKTDESELNMVKPNPELWGFFRFQRGVMVASRDQLGRPA